METEISAAPYYGRDVTLMAPEAEPYLVRPDEDLIRTLLIKDGEPVINPSPEDVHMPEEAEHKRVLRRVVDLVRRSGLLYPAVVQDDDPVAYLQGLLLIMSDHYGGYAELPLEVQQVGAELLPYLRVERAERLVKEQDPRLDSKCPRERHSLLLPAGELVDSPLTEALQLDHGEELLHLLADLLVRGALSPLFHGKTEGDVLAHGHVLEQRVVLEHEADASLLHRHFGHVIAVEEDFPAVGRLKPGDYAKERGLP